MKEIVTPLLSWYKENKRDLEWRKHPTPYHVLVSEIMLQQTRVETVRPYYHRFINELPDFQSLALCKEERLLKLWEGLGYYSRVRNLKKCAMEIMEKHQGSFPKNYEQAIKLPGVGMYTCGAVLSIAYHQKYAAVDGNVLRVLTRYMASSMDISLEKTKQYFKKELEKIMPTDAGAFNQSLMELGATICMPKVVLCDACPIKMNCMARQENTQLKYPMKPLPKEKKILEYTLLFITDGQKYVLIPKKEGVLKGLPSPILIDSYLSSNEAIDYTSSLGFHPLREIRLPDKTHTFTHQKWYMKGYKIIVDHLLDYPAFELEEIKNRLGIPTCFKQFINDLD
ncbi:MAG: A/G-specific adenine glycosylase [Anaeroplasmataceae bacterium]|nr:A/G-specific adenine glycosylase [Anaeroplasmataceae bacterium]